jgi:hypothetical protein
MDATTLLPTGVTGFLSFETIPLPSAPERLAQVGVEIRRKGQTEFIATAGDRQKLQKLYKQAAKQGGCTIILRGVGTDPNEFRGLCRQAVAVASGKWLEFKPNLLGVWSNFHWANVELQGQQLYILLNWLYPLVGFATSVDWPALGFSDRDDIARHLSGSYRVLSAAELQQPIRLVARKGRIAVLEPPNALSEGEVQNLWHWSNRGRDVISVG